MKKFFYCVLALVLLCAGNILAKSSETYFSFKIDSPRELAKLTRIISIDNVKDNVVYAYANEDEMAKFERLGYTYEVLPHPGTLIVPEMTTNKDAMTDWDVYPTYSVYVSMMNQFAADYPDLCEVVNIGTTPEGRALLFLKISDNVASEEDEPEVMYTSSIHGDETTGYVLMLRLADSLLSTYGVDADVTRLVDSCEIWINPLANPDGTYSGGDNNIYGATRYNANGVDMNRNFKDPEDGDHPDGNSWQPETVAMMNFATDHSFVISANFHGGEEVINYPWDTWARLHIDTDWMELVSHLFADTAQVNSPSGYMSGFDDGITNGYDWYTVNGGRQDYMTYFRGCREITMEISSTKLLSASQLPAYWGYLRKSLFQYLENGLYGVRGVVTDAVSGDPVFAKIEVIGHDASIDSSFVFTDPDVGDYHRMIESGIYDIKFSAPGYYDKTVKTVGVSDFTGTRVDVMLEPLPDIPVLTFASHNAGLVNPGDAVSMNITLQNGGAGNATGTAAILSTNDTYVSVTQDYSTFHTITALGGSGTSLTAYQFSVSPSCPDNHLVNFRLDVTADGGYVDSTYFTLMVGQLIENFESGGFAALPWTMSGNNGWTITSSSPYEGSYSAKSGAIANYGESIMSVTLDITSPGDISFYYKVSSEATYDFLRFRIDGVQKDEWSGSVGWTLATYAVNAGQHTFTWEYTKDVSQASGSDCGWIDKIVFPPVDMSNPPVIITNDLPDWTADYYFSQQLTASAGVGALTWSDKNNDLDGTGLSISTSGLVSGTPSGAGPISFTALVIDENSDSDEQILSFTINPAPAITTADVPDGETDVAYSQQLTASGGTGSLTWSDKNGDLTGSGFTLSTMGLLSGNTSIPASLSFTAMVTDGIGCESEQVFSFEITLSYICGDSNGDSDVNIGDAVNIINYVFKGGTTPNPLNAADANNDGDVNVADAVYLVNYIFKGGSAPVCF